MLADGDIDEAVRLAERLIQLDRNNRNAHLVLGVKALKTKNYKEARQQFGQADPRAGHRPHGDPARRPGARPAPTIPRAPSIPSTSSSGPEWYAIFKDMHAGLILDLANNKKEAGKRLEHSYKLDASALRVMQAYAGFLSRNGGREEALKIYGEFDKQLPRYPLVVEAMSDACARTSRCRASSIRSRPAPRKPCTASAPRWAAARKS